MWGSDKSQATAVLLMQRKELHQGPVRICPGQICAETGLSDRDWTLAMTSAGCWREPGIALLMEISWGETGEAILLTWWSPVVAAWASSGAAVSALLLQKCFLTRGKEL